MGRWIGGFLLCVLAGALVGVLAGEIFRVLWSMDFLWSSKQQALTWT